MDRNEFFRKSEKARKVGIGLIEDFAWDDAKLGLTIAERKLLMESLDKVLKALLIGSIDIAIDEIGSVMPIANILTQERIDIYKAKLIDLAGKL